MIKFHLTFIFVCILFFSYAQKPHNYPSTQKDSITNIYFNTIISDPYQWMENPDDPRLQTWLKSQEKIKTKAKNKYLKTYNLKGQIGAMYWGTKEKTLDGYVKKDKALKSKYQFYYKWQRTNRSGNLLFKPRGKGNYMMLVDQKKFKHNKEDHVFITNHYVNEEEDLAAIEMSHNGNDWREVYFFNLKNGQQIHNSLKFLRAGSQVVWDGRSVYYDRYEEPVKGRELLDKAIGQKLYYHKIETPQSEDIMVYKNPDTTGTNSFHYFKLNDKLFFYNTFKYKDKNYKALSVTNKSLDSFSLKKFLVYPNDDKINVNIKTVFGDSIVLSTNWYAPNGRVLMVDLNTPNKPVEIIPEYDVILKDVNRLGKEKIACVYRDGGKNLALIFDLKGNLLKKIDFPEGKKVNYLYENNNDAEYTDFCTSSFYHPNLWYQLSIKNLTFKPSVSVSVPYDPKSLETRHLKYTSKDGTEIPMYITCLKKTKLNGKNPTLIYGYGGYGTTIEPSFNESQALWLLHGGVLAIPNIRGGGAEGTDWSIAGRRLKKQNAIDDFIAAAEFLIDKKYTSAANLGINGGSHGGLLVGAALTQRPELFKAAIAEAGPFDMLRFGSYTIGAVSTNINEFGTVSDSTDFKNLKSYSPLHNVRKNENYPNVLLITGDQDDRVPPFHSYKFLAALQEKGNPESLYTIYIIPGAGHGGALTQKDWIDKELYKYAFLYSQLF